MPKLYYRGRKSSENSKSDCNDFVAEETAQEWRVASCLPKGGCLKSESIEINVQSLLQIANPTILEKPGALMMWPIYQLLFDRYYLNLTEDEIEISYKTYKSDSADDMRKIIDDKLTPGTELI